MAVTIKLIPEDALDADARRISGMSYRSTDTMLLGVDGGFARMCAELRNEKSRGKAINLMRYTTEHFEACVPGDPRKQALACGMSVFCGGDPNMPFPFCPKDYAISCERRSCVFLNHLPPTTEPALASLCRCVLRRYARHSPRYLATDLYGPPCDADDPQRKGSHIENMLTAGQYVVIQRVIASFLHGCARCNGLLESITLPTWIKVLRAVTEFSEYYGLSHSVHNEQAYDRADQSTVACRVYVVAPTTVTHIVKLIASALFEMDVLDMETYNAGIASELWNPEERPYGLRQWLEYDDGGNTFSRQFFERKSWVASLKSLSIVLPGEVSVHIKVIPEIATPTPFVLGATVAATMSDNGTVFVNPGYIVMYPGRYDVYMAPKRANVDKKDDCVSLLWGSSIIGTGKLQDIYDTAHQTECHVT